jgi:TPR repeat protein
MKRVLLSLVSPLVLFSATPAPSLQAPGAPMQQGTIENEQREFKVKADFEDFVNTMNEAMKLGQVNPYAFFLGSAYLTDFKLDDGDIPKDIKKAQYYFTLSYEDGNYAAAYQLAMIEVSRNNYGGALFVLDKAITSLRHDDTQDPFKKNLAQSFLAVTFGGITMQFLSQDKEAVERAIGLIEQTSFNEDAPTALFILANLYHVKGAEDKANALLSRACNYRGPNKDARLQAICSQFRAEEEK